MQSLQSLWDTPERRTASHPEGWYRAAVIRGELLTDECGDLVYCVAFLFLEPAAPEVFRPPFALYRIPLVGYRMGEARRLLRHFGIDDFRRLTRRLPRLFAHVHLGERTEFRPTPSERILGFRVVTAREGDGWGLKPPGIADVLML